MLHHFKRRIQKYLPVLRASILGAIFVLAVALFLVKIYFPAYQFAAANNLSPSLLSSIVFNTTPNLKSYQGRTNIAVLGIGGGNHEGADLTDTMMFLSVDFQKHDALMVSIPRDIWLDSLKDKINAAYHYGEAKEKGGGFILAKSAIEEVVGQPVHYAVLVDFSGFERLIDLLDGVDINVSTAFTDTMYPIAGKENDTCVGDPTFACRYETVHFNTGLQHMDGTTALKFVRSRHAQGEEGTDFARDQRQQKVILAIKDKVMKPSFWTDPRRVVEVIDAFNKTVLTDMNLSEKIQMARFFATLKDGSLRKVVLDAGDILSNAPNRRKGFLVNPPDWQYDGRWVLAPRTGNFDEIHKFILCQMQDPNCKIIP
ncbi:LCP family protein [Patescibacteria group bacterium]|nr:LCP family protein [Patescibacteria group bacterium]MCL5797943.1 LCP family protein [Patescibacteria group bacterium]